MSNKVQEFLNENFGQVRGMEINNVLWFVAKDVSISLKYSTTQKVTDKVDDDDIISLPKNQLTNLGNWEQSGGKDVKLINEGGLYQVISSITKKDIDRYNYSRKFKRWISNEVIPTLRNTGAYIEEEREEEVVEKYFSGLSEETKKAMVIDLMKNNKKNKIKADKWDRFLDTDSTYTFTEVSKLISTKAEEDKLDIKISNKELTKFLREQGILSKNKKGTSYLNTPNKDYEDYFNVVSVDVQGKFNKCQTRVKANGVEFIYDLLKQQKVSKYIIHSIFIGAIFIYTKI